MENTVAEPGTSVRELTVVGMARVAGLAVATAVAVMLWTTAARAQNQPGSQATPAFGDRSSRFPAALVNGHLTAANSDVRAGNYERHNNRWSGLVNWWDGFLGVLFAAHVDVPEDAGRVFPTLPRAGGKTIDVAVDDFLTSWLVEGNPALAVAYADPAAYDCLAMWLELEGRTLDRGLAPLQPYARMKTVNDAVGPRTSLDGTTRGVRLADPALKLVTHRRPAHYSIYTVLRVMATRRETLEGLRIQARRAAIGRT